MIQTVSVKWRFLVATAVLGLAACAPHANTPTISPMIRIPNAINVERAAAVPGTIPALVLTGFKTIYLLNAQDQQIGQITSPGQWGEVAMDRQGDIYYDSGQQYAGDIFIYAPPYTGKPQDISFSGIGYTRGIEVDWKTGVFALTTDSYPEIDYKGGVFFFRHGQTAKCASLQVPNGFAWDATGTFDKEGTLFVAGGSGSTETIISAAGQCSANALVYYTPNVAYVGRLQFNTKDELVIDENDGFDDAPIVTYPHPSNGELGSPIHTTKLQEIDGRPVSLDSLTSDGNHLWATNGYGKVALYNYPQGGAPIKVLNNRSGDGTVYPPPIP